MNWRFWLRLACAAYLTGGAVLLLYRWLSKERDERDYEE